MLCVLSDHIRDPSNEAENMNKKGNNKATTEAANGKLEDTFSELISFLSWRGVEWNLLGFDFLCDVSNFYLLFLSFHISRVASGLQNFNRISFHGGGNFVRIKSY